MKLKKSHIYQETWSYQLPLSGSFRDSSSWQGHVSGLAVATRYAGGFQESRNNKSSIVTASVVASFVVAMVKTPFAPKPRTELGPYRAKWSNWSKTLSTRQHFSISNQHHLLEASWAPWPLSLANPTSGQSPATQTLAAAAAASRTNG